MTDEEKAANAAERAELIRQLKEHLADPHNGGVSDAAFRAGWDGGRLREPTESWYTAACREERASR
jgi:hypothetical protein